MASFNRVVLMGNLTRNVELKYTPGGLAVAEMGLAINNKRKNQDGTWVDEVCYVDVTLFGRTAEVASEYVSKGSPIFVEGRLKYDSWDKDGQKRSKLSVVGEKIQLIGGPPSPSNSPPPKSSSASVAGGGTAPEKRSAPTAVRESSPQSAAVRGSGTESSASEGRSSSGKTDLDAGRGEAQPTGDGSGYDDPDIPF